MDIDYKLDEPWAILSGIEQSIKQKIESVGTPLKDWDIRINYGIKTGLNEAFIISKEKRDELVKADPKSDEIIRPILRGKDIKRYEYDFQNIYLINTHNGYVDENGNAVSPINIDDYPAVKEWLDSEEWNKNPKKGNSFKRLSERTDQGVTPYNLRSLAYMDDFLKRKIVFSRISGTEPKFSLDTENHFTNDTGYIISGEDLDYLLDMLVSDIIWFAFKTYYMGGGIDKEFKVNNLLNLPVPLPSTDAIKLTDEEMKFIAENIE